MALGFIMDEPMEINGATYFDKILSEGYILGSDSNSMYNVNAERMNSDLGMIQLKLKCLLLKSTNQHIAEPDEILHVSVECDGGNDAILETLHKFKNLTTLLLHGSCGPRLEQLWSDQLLSFESLSALDLSGADIKELPSLVGKMGKLKYLDLSWTLIEHLPEALTCLKRLQTLKLKGCSRIRRLPRDMKMLTELRYLEFNILGQLTIMPKGLGVLTKLRTLSSFIVGTEEGFDIKELRDLNNLSGEFCIARLEDVKSVEDAKCACVSSKSFLKKLDLRWSDFPLRDLENEIVDDSVLNNLRPHSDLEELVIKCYAGRYLSSWIANKSFHKLARLTLFKCQHVTILPPIQFLPSVEYLELVSLNSVKKVDVRGEIAHVAFQKLRTLIIDEMLMVETWTEAEEGDFPCLVELTIKDCPDLSDFPSLLYLTTLRSLEMSSCPQVKFLLGKKLSSSLQNLSVDDCPLFIESCREKEWELIKHVPNNNVWIDQEAVFEETYSNIDSGGDDDDDDIKPIINSQELNLPACSAGISTAITDTGNMGIAAGDANFMNSFPVGSLDDLTLFSDQFPPPDKDRARPSGLLAHHLQLKDSVPCQMRAKRGFATDPRSITDRVRRASISERMSKLQDLVPNMEKQTNLSDMLDFTADYIKDLQRQVQTLTNKRARCTCST